MSVQTTEVPGGDLVVRLDGDFTAPDAWAIRDALETADHATVTLDFARVHRYEDFAVALIAPHLAVAGGPRVRMLGLGFHQRRLLEYFGVRAHRADETSRADVDLAGAHA